MRVLRVFALAVLAASAHASEETATFGEEPAVAKSALGEDGLEFGTAFSTDADAGIDDKMKVLEKKLPGDARMSTVEGALAPAAEASLEVPAFIPATTRTPLDDRVSKREIFLALVFQALVVVLTVAAVNAAYKQIGCPFKRFPLKYLVKYIAPPPERLYPQEDEEDEPEE